MFNTIRIYNIGFINAKSMFMSIPMEINCINIPGNNEDFYKKWLNKFQLTMVTIFKLLTNRWKIKYEICIHEHGILNSKRRKIPFGEK